MQSDFLTRVQRFQVPLFFFLVTFFLWLPFGWQNTGTYEEWNLFNNYQEYGLFWYPIGQDARPLTALMFFISYILTPNSYLGLQIMTMLIIAVKGSMLYLVVSRIIPSKAIAFAIAGFYIIFPSDPGVFTPRTINIHAAIILYLFATLLLLQLYDSFRWYRLLLMIGTLSASLLMYDATYSIVALSPFLLLFLEKHLSRKVIKLAFWWYSTLFVLAIRLGILFFSGNALYNSGGLRNDLLTGDGIKRTLERLFIAFQHNLYLSWYDALRNLQTISITCIGLSVFLTILFVWIFRYEMQGNHTFSISGRSIGLSLVMGLILIGAGVSLLILTVIDVSFRIYLHASIGSSIFFTYSILLIVYVFPLRLKKTCLITGFVLFYFLALTNAYTQHLSYIRLSHLQQHIISQIIEQVPQHQARRMILVDETRYMISDIFARGHHVQAAANNIYEDDIQIRVCTLDSVPHVLYSQCEIQERRLIITHPDQEPVVYDLRSLIIFRYTIQHELVLVEDLEPWLSIQTDLYQPSELICQDCSPPPNVYTILNGFPFEDKFSILQNPPSEFFFDFDQPIAGENWTPSGITGEGLSVKRILASFSNIKTFLEAQDYRITFRVLKESNIIKLLEQNNIATIFDAISLSANGQNLSIIDRGDGIFEARLPSSILEESNSYLILQFDVKPTDVRIPLAFDYIKIEPE